jgi:phosphoribosylanthranilate isomerase
MIVKICGITRLSDALLAESLGADYLGFIFHPESPRYITPEAAAAIVKQLKQAKAIGVFVNHSPMEVINIAKQTGVVGVQVYQQYSEQLPKDLLRIQALRIREPQDLAPISSNLADYYLLDKYHDKAYGGTGETFDWHLLPEDKSRLFIAGGINPNNVRAACELKPYGIDVSSGVESAPGQKDLLKLKQLFQEIHSCN